MDKYKKIFNQVYNFIDLTEEESTFIFNEIMEGKLSEIEISSFLTGLKMKGESLNEIVGAVKILRKKSKKINSPENTIDTCGTGGDNIGTLNISTAAALVAASLDIKIAKHGNRSVSSKSGSADVLEKLGIKINLDEKKLEKTLFEKNFCFMFAQDFHTAMKFVSQVRKNLGTRTIFNLLGPLLNPANTKKQLIGVYDKKWINIHINVLKKLESEHVLVVHGQDGLDEISLSNKSYISELKNNKINEYIFNPEDIGYELIDINEIKGGDSEYNAKQIMKMLSGEFSNFQKIVEINAGAVIYLSGKANNLKDGAILAKKCINDGLAKSYIMNILNEIYINKKKEIKKDKDKCSLNTLEKITKIIPNSGFRNLLISSNNSKKNNIIAEIKKSSPSAGTIIENYDPIKIAQEYKKAGISALSILTDKKYFEGNLEHITLVKKIIDIPILRKDFIIDPYQVSITKLMLF